MRGSVSVLGIEGKGVRSHTCQTENLHDNSLITDSRSGLIGIPVTCTFPAGRSHALDAGVEVRLSSWTKCRGTHPRLMSTVVPSALFNGVITKYPC